MSAEGIWYKDPLGLFTKDNFFVVLPSKNQSYARQLNSVLRFSLYYGVIMFAIKRNPDQFVVPLATAGATYLLYNSFGKKSEESFAKSVSDGSCTVPTESNPFMNQLVTESSSKAPACDPLSAPVKEKIDRNFDKSLFKDVDDVWERNNSGRMFHTVPSTSSPNDQTAFAEWCYSSSRAGGKQTRPPLNSIF